MKKPIDKKIKKCYWCGEPLGEVFFTDKKTKKSFHFNLSGKDCLKSYTVSR
jgi:hypothetical protein